MLRIAASRGFSELTKNVIRSSHGHSAPSLKISYKSVQPCSRNLANQETKKDTYIHTYKEIDRKQYGQYPVPRCIGDGVMSQAVMTNRKSIDSYCLVTLQVRAPTRSSVTGAAGADATDASALTARCPASGAVRAAATARCHAPSTSSAASAASAPSSTTANPITSTTPTTSKMTARARAPAVRLVAVDAGRAWQRSALSAVYHVYCCTGRCVLYSPPYKPPTTRSVVNTAAAAVVPRPRRHSEEDFYWRIPRARARELLCTGGQSIAKSWVSK